MVTPKNEASLPTQTAETQPEPHNSSVNLPNILFNRRKFAQILFGGIFANTLPTIRSSYAGDPAASGIQKPIKNGSLVMVGGKGMTDDIITTYLDLATSPEDGTIHLVVVPTAGPSTMEKTEKYWRAIIEEQKRKYTLALLHTSDPAIANTQAFVEPLKKATALWMSGGDQNLLANAYLGTETQQEFYGILRRGGVVGGTSAGTAIMSENMIGGGVGMPDMKTGLGFFPEIVDQHFSQKIDSIDYMKP